MSILCEETRDSSIQDSWRRGYATGTACKFPRSGEFQVGEARHQTRLAGRLVADKNKLRELDIVRDSELLKLTESVIAGL